MNSTRALFGGSYGGHGSSSITPPGVKPHGADPWYGPLPTNACHHCCSLLFTGCTTLLVHRLIRAVAVLLWSCVAIAVLQSLAVTRAVLLTVQLHAAVLLLLCAVIRCAGLITVDGYVTILFITTAHYRRCHMLQFNVVVGRQFCHCMRPL